jgi:hypothetical protein
VNKKAKIIFFCMVFGVTNVFSQELRNVETKVYPSSLSKRLSLQIDDGLPILKLSPIAMQVIPPNYYTEGLGYFCKQEIKFEKNTRIPLRFRLGSINDCDRLEGKFQKN